MLEINPAYLFLLMGRLLLTPSDKQPADKPRVAPKKTDGNTTRSKVRGRNTNIDARTPAGAELSQCGYRFDFPQ